MSFVALSTPYATPRRSAEEQRLSAEVERLNDKIASLEMALYGANRDALFIDAPRHAKIALALLMRFVTVSKDQIVAAIEAEVPSSNGRDGFAGEQAVLKLRRALWPHGIDVKSRRFCGYWITPEDKATVRRVFGVAS